jgi:hypothetical protein
LVLSRSGADAQTPAAVTQVTNCDSAATDGLVLMAWQVNVNHIDVSGCDSGIVRQ